MKILKNENKKDMDWMRGRKVMRKKDNMKNKNKNEK